jgi:hypothetical protein
MPEPPPKAVERPRGFGAVVTPRQAPDHLVAAVTPHSLAAREQPTLPPAPTPAEKAEIPDDFPQGVPVPEGAKVMAVQQLANNAHNVIFSAEGESPQIFTFYKDSMKGSGWNVTQEYQGKDQSFLSFKRGKTVTNMSVSRDPKTGKRIVAIMYYEEEDLPFPEF